MRTKFILFCLLLLLISQAGFAGAYGTKKADTVYNPIEYRLSKMDFNSIDTRLKVPGGSGIYSDNSIRGISFNNDGTRLYLINSGADLYEFKLSEAWNIKTATLNYDTVLAHTTENNCCYGMYIDPNGIQMLIGHYGAREVDRYTFNSSFDLSSGYTFEQAVEFYASDGTKVEGIGHITTDGDSLFVNNVAGGPLGSFSLSTSWDLSTYTAENVYNNSNWDNNRAVQVYHGNTQMVTYSRDIDVIHRAKTTESRNLNKMTTAETESVSVSTAGDHVVHWSDNANYIYVGTNDGLVQYKLK